MGCTLALVVGGVFGMEMYARWAHKALWHDFEPGWALHKSHHEPRIGPFEVSSARRARAPAARVASSGGRGRSGQQRAAAAGSPPPASSGCATPRNCPWPNPSLVYNPPPGQRHLCHCQRGAGHALRAPHSPAPLLTFPPPTHPKLRLQRPTTSTPSPTRCRPWACASTASSRPRSPAACASARGWASRCLASCTCSYTVGCLGWLGWLIGIGSMMHLCDIYGLGITLFGIMYVFIHGWVTGSSALGGSGFLVG